VAIWPLCFNTHKKDICKSHMCHGPCPADCSCFAALRHIRSIRRSVSQPVLLSLVTSLVLSRLDYGSVRLNGITRRPMDRLQSVLNAADRLVYNSLSTIGSRRSCTTCTGCAFLNASSSVWPFLCSAAVTRPHLNT